MTRADLLPWLEAREKPVLTDGAMGTFLHDQGIPLGACFDHLNLTDPERVLAVHRAYLDAGSEVVLTNTFGANTFKLRRHGLEHLLADINRSGVDLARRAVAASGGTALVAGDIGPLGLRLAPLGRLAPDDAAAAFAAQAELLLDGGVDLLVLETFADLRELELALRTLRRHDIPIVASMTFGRDDRTLLGETAETVVRRLRDAGADIVGVNCSEGPAQVLRILGRMRTALPDALLWAKPNAGGPERTTDRVFYPASPAYFADHLWPLRLQGASFLGGCCGTTPSHIAAMREARERGPSPAHIPADILPAPSRTVSADLMAEDRPSELSRKLREGRFVFAVEVDPPHGLGLDDLVAAASLLAEAGADVIDVADSPMARMRMSPWAVCAVIQQRAGVETTLHFPVRGRNLLRIQGDLLAAHALGLRNLLVITGDPTSIGDHPGATDTYDITSTDLIRLVKQRLNQGLDYAGNSIGRPTLFFVAAALNLSPTDPEHELRNLQAKLEAGADLLLSQPVYDPPKALAFLDRCRSALGPLPPLLVGILPAVSLRHARFLHNEVPGIFVPDTVFRRLEEAGPAAAEEGVRIASELVEQIRPWAQGIYLMPPFQRYELAARIIETARRNP